MIVRRLVVPVINLGVAYVPELNFFNEECVLGGTSFGAQPRSEVVLVPYSKIMFGTTPVEKWVSVDVTTDDDNDDWLSDF